MRGELARRLLSLEQILRRSLVVDDSNAYGHPQVNAEVSTALQLRGVLKLLLAKVPRYHHCTKEELEELAVRVSLISVPTLSCLIRKDNRIENDHYILLAGKCIGVEAGVEVLVDQSLTRLFSTVQKHGKPGYRVIRPLVDSVVFTNEATGRPTEDIVVMSDETAIFARVSADLKYQTALRALALKKKKVRLRQDKLFAKDDEGEDEHEDGKKLSHGPRYEDEDCEYLIEHMSPGTTSQPLSVFLSEQRSPKQQAEYDPDLEIIGTGSDSEEEHEFVSKEKSAEFKPVASESRVRNVIKHYKKLKNRLSIASNEVDRSLINNGRKCMLKSVVETFRDGDREFQNRDVENLFPDHADEEVFMREFLDYANNDVIPREAQYLQPAQATHLKLREFWRRYLAQTNPGASDMLPSTKSEPLLKIEDSSVRKSATTKNPSATHHGDFHHQSMTPAHGMMSSSAATPHGSHNVRHSATSTRGGFGHRHTLSIRTENMNGGGSSSAGAHNLHNGGGGFGHTPSVRNASHTHTPSVRNFGGHNNSSAVGHQPSTMRHSTSSPPNSFGHNLSLGGNFGGGSSPSKSVTHQRSTKRITESSFEDTTEVFEKPDPERAKEFGRMLEKANDNTKKAFEKKNPRMENSKTDLYRQRNGQLSVEKFLESAHEQFRNLEDARKSMLTAMFTIKYADKNTELLRQGQDWQQVLAIVGGTVDVFLEFDQQQSDQRPFNNYIKEQSLTVCKHSSNVFVRAGSGIWFGMVVDEDEAGGGSNKRQFTATEIAMMTQELESPKDTGKRRRRNVRKTEDEVQAKPKPPPICPVTVITREETVYVTCPREAFSLFLRGEGFDKVFHMDRLSWIPSTSVIQENHMNDMQWTRFKHDSFRDILAEGIDVRAKSYYQSCKPTLMQWFRSDGPSAAYKHVPAAAMRIQRAKSAGNVKNLKTHVTQSMIPYTSRFLNNRVPPGGGPLMRTSWSGPYMEWLWSTGYNFAHRHVSSLKKGDHQAASLTQLLPTTTRRKQASKSKIAKGFHWDAEKEVRDMYVPADDNPCAPGHVVTRNMGYNA